ncbi:MAG: ArsR family transcriptional regulator [Puniceicoccaceae bacterium 5H]|nr:MAG: ArsR family transcriptional regulator [Puniceicoccaceae bacterium 5H]
MQITGYFRCFSEPTRLRILNLLRHGPLCVCHIQEILGEPQAKVSKQLSYLKQYELVASRRHYNWTIYSLPEPLPPCVEQILALLEQEPDCERVLLPDTQQREALLERLSAAAEPGEPLQSLISCGLIGCERDGI